MTQWQQVNHVKQSRLARQVPYLPCGVTGNGSGNLLRNSLITGTTKDPDLHTLVERHFGDPRVVLCGPAFCITKLRTRAQTENMTCLLESQFLKQLCLICQVDL